MLAGRPGKAHDLFIAKVCFWVTGQIEETGAANDIFRNLSRQAVCLISPEPVNKQDLRRQLCRLPIRFFRISPAVSIEGQFIDERAGFDILFLIGNRVKLHLFRTCQQSVKIIAFPIADVFPGFEADGFTLFLIEQPDRFPAAGQLAFHQI